MTDDIAERLIVALDLPAVREAEELSEKLSGSVSFFKIGFSLLLADGVERLIDRLVKSGKKVFLDCKMYDIGATVQRGVERARDRGIRFLTVHGDEEIMQAAVAGRGSSDFLKILAVTVLTSLNDEALREMGFSLALKDLLARRVKSAAASGVDGIIAAPRDRLGELRRLSGNDHLLIATPGIRPAGRAVDDHKRSATPTEAIINGADYLIVGRPIIAAPDPAKAAAAIIAEMQSAVAERPAAGRR